MRTNAEVRMHPYSEDLTEAEGMVIEALRSAERAQSDEAYRDRLSAWEFVRQVVDWYDEGDYTMEHAREFCGEENAAEHFGGVQAVAALLPLFAPGYHVRTRDVAA